MDHIQRQSALTWDRKINLVLDIGANEGHYGKSLRDNIGYKGHIVSFEPLRDAFAILQLTAARDPLWESCKFIHNESLVSASAGINRFVIIL